MSGAEAKSIAAPLSFLDLLCCLTVEWEAGATQLGPSSQGLNLQSFLGGCWHCHVVPDPHESEQVGFEPSIQVTLNPALLSSLLVPSQLSCSLQYFLACFHAQLFLFSVSISIFKCCLVCFHLSLIPCFQAFQALWVQDLQSSLDAFLGRAAWLK